MNVFFATKYLHLLLSVTGVIISCRLSQTKSIALNLVITQAMHIGMQSRQETQSLSLCGWFSL